MIWQYLIVLALAYLVGSLPVGWALVWLVSRRDIRYHASGKMGTSNVIRTIGVKWGLLTAVCDVLKGFLAVWIVRWSFAERMDWMIAAAGILAVLGHIKSIFLIETVPSGQCRLRGGAGGLTSLGVVIGILPSVIFIAGIPALILYMTLGYASVATFSINLFATVTFIVMRLTGMEPSSWWYVLYGIFGLAIVYTALKPNFKRLREGKERVMKFSLRGILRKRAENDAAEARDADEAERPEGEDET